MKRITEVIAVICFILLCSGNLIAEDNSVSLAVTIAPPLSLKDDSGKISGIWIDLATALSEKAGYKVTVSEYPWSRALEYLKDGTVEMIVGLSKTPEREEFAHFLGTAYYEQNVVVVKKNNANLELKSLDALAKEGYMWGIRENAFYTKELNDRIKNDPNFAKHFDAVAKTIINLQKIQADRITGSFGDKIAVGYTLKSDNTLKDLTFIEVPFFPQQPAYFGISKKISPDKLDKLKIAYSELEKDGAFQKIVDTWTK